MSEQWEYKILHVSALRWTGTGLPNELGVAFDQLGQEGWELVGTESIQRAGLLPWGATRTVGIVAFFKRRA